MILHLIGSFMAVITLSIIFCVPKKYLTCSSLVGALGWVLYLKLMHTGFNEMIAMFTAAFLVSLLSQIFARIFKAPVTIFLVPGILPLVPGVGMYRIVYYLLLEDSAMSGYYFLYTLQMASMIAVAIFVTDTLFQIIRRFGEIHGRPAD